MATSRAAVLLSVIAAAGIATAQDGAAKSRKPATGSATEQRDDAALRAEARRVCHGPMYTGSVRIIINYAQGWFRCEERIKGHL
jgi:hypothetical protein